MGTERRKQMPWQGRTVEGVEVSVQSSQEPWAEYLLTDGSVVRMKIVATDFVRLDGEHDSNGDPIYVVKSTNIITISAHDSLRRLSPGT